MNKYLVSLLITLISGAFYAVADDHCSGSTGEIAACHLNKAYNNTAAECHSGSPAGLCSGVIFRGVTLHSKRTHRAWSIRPDYAGASFSYLRKDAGFSRLAYEYQSGFIFYPVDHTPAGQTKVHILCGFSFDGDTVNRTGMCGQDRQHTESQPCPPGMTGTQWAANFEKYGSDPATDHHSCGFVLQKGAPGTKEAFQAMLEARNILIGRHPDYFKDENELVLDKWATETVKDVQSIPIEAFFYIAGSSDGLQSAQADQKDFYQDSGNTRIIPVISMKLPASAREEAVFTYSSADQVVR